MKEGVVETTCYELTNQKTHGLNATKDRQTGELSNIQTTDPEQEGTRFPDIWEVGLSHM